MQGKYFCSICCNSFKAVTKFFDKTHQLNERLENMDNALRGSNDFIDLSDEKGRV